MTRVDPSPTPPSSPPQSTELRIEVDLQPGRDSALLRVFATLHRRRCRVVEIGYEEVTGRLSLRVEAPRRQASHVAAWVGSLVEVHRVIAI